ncbi:putative aryl-alcohol dehydrogenase [Delphinella strobiligena]|nr:putative aryl-alcohol dehydrogenase [Delphinella strobiligena]
MKTDRFDYIIIGGGTSGLVIASRLTEDHSIRVLVIEAGADRRNDPRSFIPGLAAQAYDDPDFDWSFQTTPQRGLGGRRVHQPAGKGVGGSSSINLGMMIFPSASGFNAWESLGNDGWNWKEVTQYFRKFHTYHPPSKAVEELLSVDYIDNSLHGTDGPIHACFGEDVSSYTAYHEAWPKAFKALDYETTGDPLSGVSKGAFTDTGTIDPKTKQRSHAGNTYYNDSVARRSNLQLLTETLVTRIIFDDDTYGPLVATGVEVVTKDEKRSEYHATAEIVLAAGAVKSPQLLELSGIGPANLLQTHGIGVRIDNPHVGENLQEHGFVPISYEIEEGQVSGDSMRDPAVANALLSLYTDDNGAGPLGVCSLVSSFMPVVSAAQDEDLDDLLDAHLENPDIAYKEFKAKNEQYALLRDILHDPEDASGQYTFAPFQLLPEKGPSPKGIFSLSEEGQYVTIVAVLNHPFSRGSTHITSSDPLDKPEIDTGLMEHPLDLELLARHVQWIEELAAAEPFAKLLKPNGRRLPPHQIPGAKMTLQEAKEIVRDRLVPHYHLCGTCAMMPERLGGVVNSRLLVHGTKNLRIVDASVFPLIPRGNIQADVYAVAEKAADIMKEDAREMLEGQKATELLGEWRKTARPGVGLRKATCDE